MLLYGTDAWLPAARSGVKDEAENFCGCFWMLRWSWGAGVGEVGRGRGVGRVAGFGKIQSSQNNLCIHVMGLYDLAKKWEKIGGNLCVLITLR